MKVNFITNLPLSEKSGGWPGCNVGLYEALAGLTNVSYVGPINPGIDYFAGIPSKVARMLGRRGSFHFFSKRRLDRTAAVLGTRLGADGDCNLFFGNTPWIHCHSSLPYFVYSDCSFHTYLETYHNVSEFNRRDIERIVATEAAWLTHAQGVLVTTSWATVALRDVCRVPESKIKTVGLGGAITPPLGDVYESGADLVFIAYDFERKGGRICFEALKLLEKKIPEVRLVIIGGRPDDEVMNHGRVKYLGTLRKTDAVELAQFRSILEKAFLFLHASMVDVGTGCVFEAAYHGCPTVAPKRHCYMDQVQDQITGLLVDLPLSAEKFADCILALYGDQERYRRIRRDARAYALRHCTWDSVARKVLHEMKERLAVVDREAH